jgi:hypothetical protein
MMCRWQTRGCQGERSRRRRRSLSSGVFARGREKIQLLRNQLVKEGHNPSDLGVPEAKECTIAKLAGEQTCISCAIMVRKYA